MGWNGNYFSRPTFGCVDFFFKSVHLGNQEAVMQWNVSCHCWEIRLGWYFKKHACWTPVGVKSLCERSCAFCLNRNVADFTIQECFIRGTKELFHHHFAKIILYNAKPLSVWVCCPNPIYYDFSIIVQFLLSFCNHSSLSQSKNNLKNMKVTFLKFNSTIQGLNLILQQPSLSLTYAVVFVFVRRFICWF